MSCTVPHASEHVEGKEMVGYHYVRPCRHDCLAAFYVAALDPPQFNFTTQFDNNATTLANMCQY